jgi:hypothetical protein
VIRAAAAAATAAADSAAAATEASADSGSASADAAHTVADSAEAGPSASKAHANIFESDSGGKAEKRKHAQGAARKRSGPLHAPGTYVYDEVEAACSDGQYTCGAVLMPAGHALENTIYCNVALTCAAPLESTLYGLSASALKQPLVDFSKSSCSICGVEQLSDAARKDQGCNGDKVKSWTAYPLCGSCAARGFKPTPVRKTESQSARAAREKKRKRAAPVRRAEAEEGIVSDSD